MNVRRSLFLQEMGYAPQWQRREAPVSVDAGTAPALASVPATAQEPELAPARAFAPVLVPVPTPASAPAPAPAPASVPSPEFASERAPAQEPESAPAREFAPTPASAPTPATVPASVFASERTSAPEFAITPAPDPADAPPAAPDIARHPASRAADLATLQQLASRCTACARSEQRQRSVFGTGDVHPDWLLIGDAPAVADEADGVPFGGKSGQLLDNMLAAVGKGRNQGNQGHQGAYLTNLVKCCARDEQGQSRAPSADEIAACRPFLQRQIELLQPKLVLALGKTAAQALRQASPAPTPLRGVVHHMQDGNLPMVATWHPVILLQQPQEKRQVWADLCLARETEAQAVLPSGEPS